MRTIFLATALILAIAAVILGVFGGASKSSPNEAKSSHPSTSTSIFALGRLVPGEAVIRLTASTESGQARVGKLLVRVNDSVGKGQVVAILDNEPVLRSQLESSKALVALRKRNFERVLAGVSRFEMESRQAVVERLEAELRQRDQDRQRFEVLFLQGIVSKSDWEGVKLAAQNAQARLGEARAALAQSKEVRPEEIAVARSEIGTAEAEVKKAESSYETAFVRSPVAGRILEVRAYPGERVTDEGLADIGRTSEMMVLAEVYETDVSKLRQGGKAVITSPAIPEPLTGSIERIGSYVARQNVVNTDPAANTDGRVIPVRVRLELKKSSVAAELTNLQVRVEFKL
jgi:HlyD family secretion protein